MTTQTPAGSPQPVVGIPVVTETAPPAPEATSEMHPAAQGASQPEAQDVQAELAQLQADMQAKDADLEASRALVTTLTDGLAQHGLEVVQVLRDGAYQVEIRPVPGAAAKPQAATGQLAALRQPNAQATPNVSQMSESQRADLYRKELANNNSLRVVK